jgi:hypothetical protein
MKKKIRICEFNGVCPSEAWSLDLKICICSLAEGKSCLISNEKMDRVIEIDIKQDECPNR